MCRETDIGTDNLKTAALINSRFAEPLLLDSDNIPIIAPESLWESDEYREYGTIFWPDIARYERKRCLERF